MRKLTFLAALLISCIGLQAQEYYINLHQSGQVMYQNNVNEINSMYLGGNNPTSFNINTNSGINSFPVTAFDSITFVLQEPPQLGDTVTIYYNGNTATIVNPYNNDGVSVSNNGSDVTVNSTKTGVCYRVSGSSTNGSLTIYSNADYNLILHPLNLTSNSTAAMNLATNNNVTLTLKGGSTLIDNANSTAKAALCAAGNLTVNNGGNGTLNISGYAKHGINVDGSFIVNGGSIFIGTTDGDGIHCSGDLIWNNGFLNIVSSGSDGLDVSGNVTIQHGEQWIHTDVEGARGIKVSGICTLNESEMYIYNSGTDTKGIKCDSLMFINSPNLHIENSGDMSKGIKTDQDLTINGGNITIISSGSTVLENVNNQNVPAYCTAIKSDANILINDGSFHITLPESNHGGKSISADGNLTITGGYFSIETHGNGAAYTVTGNTKDSYTSSCLKCDGNMEILAGEFNLTSTGTGGKGINAGGTMKIGLENASNYDLILNVTTSGERITVTAGGGWPGPGGGGGDYANPKAIKSQGNLTINSGTIHVECLQTQNEGGEGIESKAVLTINGGDIEVYSKKDDAVNASSRLIINGGVYYAHSDANDGTDSNGQMELNGGFNISNGAAAPEEGFDCDNNQFKITGGTCIGTGGGTSGPTLNVCTQPSVRINTQPGYAIQILNSSGTAICTYQCPTFTGGGGGWPGPGGGNNMVMLFTDPQFQMGQTYTIKYGGTISGGTNWNGYYTGNVTYSGGQTTTYTVNSMFSSVNAGGSGGGWKD